MIADSNLMGVAAQVFYHLCRASHWFFKVSYPFGVIQCGAHRRPVAMLLFTHRYNTFFYLLVQPLKKVSTINFTHRFYRKQKMMLCFFRFLPPFVGINTA